MKKLLVLVLLLFVWFHTVQATALGDAVAQMAEKSWRPLQTLNLLNTMLHSGPVMDVNYAFSNDACWDPVSEQILYLGGPHGSAMIFNAYSAPDNTWREESISGLGNHSWDCATVDPDKGYLYLYQSDGIHRWNIRTNKWESKTSGLGETRFGSLEYFPEMNGLVYVYAGGVYLYSYSGGWSTIKTGLTMGSMHNVGAYSPVHKCLLFGGGTKMDNGPEERKLYKMDANKKITQLNDAPFSFGVHEALMTLEPVTGNFIFCNDSNIYYYDLNNDTWTNLGKSFATRGSRTVVASISTYGVVCFLNDGSYPVLLYKYADNGSTVQQSRRIVPGSIVIEAHPNPFRSAVNINVNTSAQTGIYNLNGRLMKQFRAPSFLWNAQGLPSGIYILKTNVGKHTHTKRLFLEK